MVFEADQEYFGPKILIQRVLSFHHGEIIARGDDATVKHDQVVFPWGEDNALLTTSGEKEEPGATETGKSVERFIFHLEATKLGTNYE